MGRRVLVLVTVCVAAVAAVAAAFAANGEPQKKHTPADMASAKGVVLRVSDFPSTWKHAASTSSDNGAPRCKNGFEPDESDLVETGTADSPDFSLGLRYVGSSAGVFRTAAMAQASWDRVNKPGLLPCLASIFEKGATGNGTKATVTAKGALPFPKLAPRTAAYRIAVKVTSGATTLTGVVDIVLLGKGRVDAVLLYTAFGANPIAEEKRLGGLVAHRLP